MGQGMNRELLLEQNLKAWEIRYPGSRHKIEDRYKEWKNKKEKGISVDAMQALDGNIILKVTKDGKQRYLGGKRNCKAPIETWADAQGSLERTTLYFIGGIGNPYYIEQLLQKRIEGQRLNIIIYEPSEEIFFTAMEAFDLTDILKEQSDCIIVIEGLSGVSINNVIERMITVERFDGVKTFLLPNYYRIFPDEMMEYAKTIRKQCDSCASAINTRVRFSAVYAQNMFANAHFLLDGYKTRQLAEVIPRDIPAIVVAAGPSLDKNIDELKRAKGRSFIIAVDTAIKPLLKRGIMPDMFAIVDGKKPLELIQYEGAEKIPLLTSITAANPVLSYHKGMKFFFNEGDGYINEIYALNGKSFESVACGGSVATIAFSLAFMIGIDTVILVGQDLALTGNKTHADGTFHEHMGEVDTSRYRTVPGNVEEKVPIRGDFWMYLNWYNDYIKSCKEYRKAFRVINATEGGARIENTEIMSLREAIDNECVKEVDIASCLQKLTPVLNSEEREKSLQYLHDTPQRYHEMAEDAVNINTQYKKLKKICTSRNINMKSYENTLKKIKKFTKKLENNRLYYEPVKESLALANYVVQSEQHEEKDSLKEEGKEIARQGIIYTDMVRQCAELFEEYTKETVGKAE